MSSEGVPRFLIDADAIRDGHVRLTGPELHHLRVRRLHVGSGVRLLDRHGVEYAGVVQRVGPREADVGILSADRPQRESPLRLTLAQAVLKGAHLDVVIEKATELGVAEILLFTCARSIGRAPASRFARWERIGVSAAKQCGRLLVPDVNGPVGFDAVLRRIADNGEPEPAVLFQPGSAPLPHTPPPTSPRRLVIIGPEGGFAPAEIEAASRAGCTVAGLGPRVLRSETAALTAMALCQFLWGDLGGPVTSDQ